MSGYCSLKTFGVGVTSPLGTEIKIFLSVCKRPRTSVSQNNNGLIWQGQIEQLSVASLLPKSGIRVCCMRWLLCLNTLPSIPKTFYSFSIHLVFKKVRLLNRTFDSVRKKMVAPNTSYRVLLRQLMQTAPVFCFTLTGSTAVSENNTIVPTPIRLTRSFDEPALHRTPSFLCSLIPEIVGSVEIPGSGCLAYEAKTTTGLPGGSTVWGPRNQLLSRKSRLQLDYAFNPTKCLG